VKDLESLVFVIEESEELLLDETLPLYRIPYIAARFKKHVTANLMVEMKTESVLKLVKVRVTV